MESNQPVVIIEETQDARGGDGGDGESIEAVAVKNGNKKDDESLDFSYDAVFKQPKSNHLAKTPNTIVRIIYDWTRSISYYCLVFLVSMPIVVVISFVNALMVWLYSWILLPTLKIVMLIERMVVVLLELLVKTACEPIVRCLEPVCSSIMIIRTKTKKEDKTAKVDIVAKIQTV